MQQNIIRAMAMYIDATKKLKMKRLDKLPSIIANLTKAIEILHVNMTMPCQELVEVIDTFIKAFQSLNGERFEIPNLR